MSTSRTFLIPFLENEFKDGDKKKKYQEAVKKKILSNYQNRLFDDFDVLASSDSLTQFKLAFKEICADVPQVDADDLSTLLLARNKKAIEQMERQIAQLACNELLNDDGELKPELLTLLNCAQTPLRNGDIVCAYVAALNHLIMKAVAGDAKCDAIGPVVCNFLNSNKRYGIWVKEEMSKKGHQAKFDPNAIIREIVYLPIEKPEIFFSIMGGVAAAISAGFMLASIFAKANQKQSSRSGSHNRPTPGKR